MCTRDGWTVRAHPFLSPLTILSSPLPALRHKHTPACDWPGGGVPHPGRTATGRGERSVAAAGARTPGLEQRICGSSELPSSEEGRDAARRSRLRPSPGGRREGWQTLRSALAQKLKNVAPVTPLAACPRGPAGCCYFGGITTRGGPRFGRHMRTWASLALGLTSALGGMGSMRLRMRGCSC